MIRALGLIALLLLPGPVSGLAVAQPSSVKVFIGAATEGDFIDTSKEVQDSIKDLTGRMRGTKGVVFVASRDGADVIVTVVARGVGSEPYGQRLAYQERLYRGAELTSTPISLNTWWVTAVLEYPSPHTGRIRRQYSSAGRLITMAAPGVSARAVFQKT
jgi:hypothetical protein